MPQCLNLKSEISRSNSCEVLFNRQLNSHRCKTRLSHSVTARLYFKTEVKLEDVWLFLVLDSFPSIFALSCSGTEIEKSRIADKDDRHLTIMTQLFCHMTSSLVIADLRENIFGRTIYTQSIIVKALTVSAFWRGRNAAQPPPFTRPQNTKKLV